MTEETFPEGSGSMESKKLIEAGKIVNTHGIKGEVKIDPWTDSPEFLRGFKTLYIGSKPVRVISARVQNGFVIARLEAVEDINAAMALKNKLVYIDRADAKLPEGRFFIADMLGSRVLSDKGEDLGVLEDVMDMPAGNIYVVKGGREILIPDVPEFILSIDPEKKLITVHLIEGM